MEKADFIHLMRLSEQESADNPQAYRRHLARFAALGYGWVIGCALLALALLAWPLSQWIGGSRFHWSWLGFAAPALGLLWSSLRALWVRLLPPEGEPLAPSDAPALFEALERIRRKIKGPPLHHVLLNDEFNACIVQLPRFGMLGGSVNYLVVGLPLLMALDRKRLLAVLAHEYGHLREGHGRFSSRIYRSRLAWSRLLDDLRSDDNLVSSISLRFFSWYLPRFHARSFALARQDEYEADRIAAKLMGADTASAALVEIEVKGDWLAQEFWAFHWQRALASATPLGPYEAMRQALALPPMPDFGAEALRAALRRVSNEDDTHPGLRDRIEALQPGAVHSKPPAWSAKPALPLLKDPQRWIKHFDALWQQHNAHDWELHHAWFQRLQERIQTLRASAARNDAQETTELADLLRQLDPTAPAIPWYQRALELSPEHPAALRGLAACMPTEQRTERLQVLERLYAANKAEHWWASSRAVAILENPVDDPAALQRWRERLRSAEAAEQRAWAELHAPPLLGRILRPDLNEFERGELAATMRLWPTVDYAWVASKQLQEYPWRRCYLLVIDTSNLSDDALLELCAVLERRLPLPGPCVVVSSAQGVDTTRLPSTLERIK